MYDGLARTETIETRFRQIAEGLAACIDRGRLPGVGTGPGC